MDPENKQFKRRAVVKKLRTSKEENPALMKTEEIDHSNSDLHELHCGTNSVASVPEISLRETCSLDLDGKSTLYPDLTMEVQAATAHPTACEVSPTLPSSSDGCCSDSVAVSGKSSKLVPVITIFGADTEACNQTMCGPNGKGAHLETNRKFESNEPTPSLKVHASDVTPECNGQNSSECENVFIDKSQRAQSRKLGPASSAGAGGGVAPEGHSETPRETLCGPSSQGQRDATDRAVVEWENHGILKSVNLVVLENSDQATLDVADVALDCTGKELLGDSSQGFLQGSNKNFIQNNGKETNQYDLQGANQTSSKFTHRNSPHLASELIALAERDSTHPSAAEGINDGVHVATDQTHQVPERLNCATEMNLAVGTPQELRERDRVEAECESQGNHEKKFSHIVQPNEVEWSYIRRRAVRVPGSAKGTVPLHTARGLGSAEVLGCEKGGNEGCGVVRGSGRVVTAVEKRTAGRDNASLLVGDRSDEKKPNCLFDNGVDCVAEQSGEDYSFINERKSAEENDDSDSNKNLSDLDFKNEVTQDVTSTEFKLETFNLNIPQVSPNSGVQKIDRLVGDEISCVKTTEMMQGISPEDRTKTNAEESAKNTNPRTRRKGLVLHRQNQATEAPKIVILKQKSRSSEDISSKMKFHDELNSTQAHQKPLGTIEDQMDYPIDLITGDTGMRKSKSHSNLFPYFKRKISSTSTPKGEFSSSESLKTSTGLSENLKWVIQNTGTFFLPDDSSDKNVSRSELLFEKSSLYPRLDFDKERASISKLSVGENEGSDRKTSLSIPMEMLFSSLVKGSEIVKDVTLREPEFRLKDELLPEQNEALLKHVVHALVHALGNDVKAKWTLHADSLGLTAGDAHPSAETEVTLAAVLEELKKIFQVDEAKIQEIIRGVSDNTEKLVPELALHLHVHEAKDLKMKSVSGSTNPYVTASLPWDTQKTRLLHQTRCPAWDQRFVMKVKDIQKEVLKLEVWHEHEHLGVGVVKDIRDLKGLGRLVKGTTAPDHLLLGSVTVPLKDVPEDGLESWFPLLKEDPQQPPALVPATSPPSHFSLSSQLAQLKTTGASLIHHGAQKQRGQLRVSVHFGPVQSSGPVPSGRNYEGLLVKAVLRHVDTPDGMVLWSGKLPPETLCALHITALVDGLRSDDKLLALWNAACRTPMSDSVWLAEILTRILQKDRKDMPSHAVPDIQASLLAWLSHAEDQLSHLHASFPPHRGVTSSHQLGGLLRGLRQLSRGSMSSELLKENIDVEEVVRKAVERHISRWWLALIERELRDTVSPDDQVLRVINITDECYDFIAQATSLYSPVFVCDFGLPYLRIAYLFITKKLNPCVRPLLMNIYSRLLSSSSSSDTKAGDSTNKDYALSAGSSLWQLYINLGRIHKQGASLPPEVRQESGVREYHRWFSKGVMHWLQVAQARIQRIISNAVEADQLVPCDEFCTFSSSATDAVTVFVGVRNWWLELAWPDPQNSGVLLGKILEDLCSCAIFYCDLLRHKVDRIYEEQQGEGKVFITKQICIGLNNMERVREEVSTLPESFKVPTLLASIAAADPNNKDGDRAAAEQFKGTFERLISSSMENMEAKVKEFVEAVVDKVSGTLLLGLTDACEAQDPDLLLGEVLDPGLSLMRHALTDACFRRFLLRLWESLLQLTRSLVVRSAERRRAEFFQAVHDTLTSSLQFFTPAGGLAMEEAMTDEYTSLIELLATLRLSSEQLIGQYYQERAEERQLMGVTSRGELFVNVFFTPSSKLVVEVVMARDFQVEDEVSSVSSRTSHVGLRGLVTGTTHVPVDAYVKVQLVPAELFPSAQTFSTKVLKRSDPAIFQETFTYVLSADDPQARAGYLLLTLKDHNVARANTFLGEAVVPLSGVPAVADESVASQPRTMQLKLTRPGIEAGYKPIATLRMRSSSDRVASAFVKKIAGRFADARLRKESRDLAPPGADDERSPEKGGRSPKIFDRIFKQES